MHALKPTVPLTVLTPQAAGCDRTWLTQAFALLLTTWHFHLIASRLSRAKIKCSICSSQFNTWDAQHCWASCINRMFEQRVSIQSLLCRTHGLSRYCSTSGFGPRLSLAGFSLPNQHLLSLLNQTSSDNLLLSLAFFAQLFS